jgi:putative NIF3 family GTP cyclohydrolase 1 type 2
LGDIPTHYDIPATPLSVLASDVKYRLGGRGGIRVIGDPRTRVQTIAFLPGTTAIPAALAALPDVDLIIAGEVREWESAEYARDVVFSGQRKGVMLVGRILSEDPGMALCARWLGDLVPEVSVRHISAGDPYWRPEA